jgi:putative NADPH-quinone reductase
MQILALVAHDKSTSLTKKIFHHAINIIEKNPHCTVDILDLYERAAEIPFYISDRAQLEAHPFYQENKERFMKADRLLIVFPTYWYSTPGILKCWFDLINQFAWKFQGTYQSALPLHSIKKAVSINLTITPVWYNWLFLGDPARKQVQLTLKFLAIEPLMHTVGNSTSLKAAQLEKQLQCIEKLCKELTK